MKSIALSASPREIGKTSARKLRNQGLVPCVLYGGKENLHFATEELAFDKLVSTPDVYSLDIDLEGKKYSAIIQQVQYHPVTDRVSHVDLIELFEDKQITMHVPVKLQGAAIGVKNGGILRLRLKKLKVKGLPSAIPDSVKINIEKLDVGDGVKIGDLELGDLEILHVENAVVVAVRTARKIVAPVIAEEEEEEEGAEAAEGAEAEAAEGEEAKAEAEGGKPEAEEGKAEAES